MNNLHEPTPEFSRFLEWQVTSAVRRQTRFVEPPRPAYVKYFGVAALVLVSILVGAGGVTAAGRIQANEQTKALLARQAGDVRVAQLQVDIAKTAVDMVKRQTDVGAASKEDLATAELILLQATVDLKRASLNSEEIGASGKPIQDDLAAPLVGKRDFVTERLQLDQQITAAATRQMTDKLKAVKTRYEVGLVGEVELADAQAKMTRAAAEARSVETQTDLRRQFLAGKIKAPEMARRKLISATTSQLAIAEGDFAAATQRYALAEKKAQVGTTTEVDVLKAKLEMMTLQQDIAQLKARIRQLEEGR